VYSANNARGTYIVQDNQLIGPPTLAVADGIEHAVPPDRRDQLLSEKHKQRAANERQVQVVHLEEPIQLQRLSAAHDLPPAKDDDIVRDEQDRRRLEGRHGRDALLEAEVLRLVAHDRGEDPVEDGPDGQAKGPVERGHAVLEPFGVRHCDWGCCGRGE
jgi:hypothetical protein